MVIWQAHHLREAGVDIVNLIDYARGDHDISSAIDPYWPIIDRVTDPCARPRWQVDRGLWHTAYCYRDSRRTSIDATNPQLRIQVHIVVPGQVIGGAHLAGRHSHHF